MKGAKKKVVFGRNNLAYNRFWEGRTQLQVMDSKWTDVVSQVRL